MEPSIFFEDENLFAVSKPAGMHSVGEGSSISNWLAEKYPELREVSDKREDSGLIHRLDFGTSGVLIGAKSREVWQELRKLLQDGKIRKEYTILVEGHFEHDTKVDNFLGSPYRRGKKVRVFETEKPRTLRAVSTFRLRNYSKSLNVSEVGVSCALARRHQVRVHAASLGHPLVGDTLYGSGRRLDEILPGQAREFYLHAGSADFVHPVTRAPVTLQIAPELLLP